MKSHFAAFGKRATAGRPPVAELTPLDLQTIQSYYLATNRNKKEGSILLAWVRFCESRPEFRHLVSDHMPETSIPSAVVDACRRAKALVGPYRGGERRLRHEAAYVPGTMRRHHEEKRRLMAGERASVDDATRNVACYIPWPWGGCPCSEKYGVRIGRWQTLIVHDDATGYVPFVSSVFRFQQSYRATDAASVIFKAERDVLQWDAWSIEGGVWQAKRTLAVLGGRYISAKGRPNQKLVENYIGRLWGVMAGQPGDVGRHQAEMKKDSDLYVKCRQGHADPRKHFMPLGVAQEALYASIQYLNEKRIESRTYGKWVPQSRWEADLKDAFRPARMIHDDFLILPVAKTHKVRGGTLKTTEDGPHGCPMVWSFMADWLWQHEGQEMTLYFDPLDAWPATATVTLKDSKKALGTVECVTPLDASRDRAVEMAKAIRQTMMTETRVLSTMHTERTVRHAGGILSSVSAAPEKTAAAAPVEPVSRSLENGGETDRGSFSRSRENDRQALPELDFSRGSIPARDGRAAVPQATREDVAASLSRRAAMARGELILTPTKP